MDALEPQQIFGNDATWPSLRAYRKAADDSLARLERIRSASRDGLTLFCSSRNEAEILPSFLEHYRRLGVQRFVVVDNGSTDKTQAVLENESDVDLYWTDDGYGDNNYGMLWIDGLIHKLALGRWVLNVDVDERLVYSKCDVHPLSDLISEMKRCNIPRLFAPMVDLYDLNGVRHFDATPDLIRHWERGVSVMGGPRHRMALAHGLKPMYTLTKYPLVFYDESTAYACTHFPLPNVLNNGECIARLLHTKLLENFAEKVKVALVENRFWQDSLGYRNYSRWVGADLRFEFSRSYEQPEDLVASGLMKPINWKDAGHRPVGSKDLRSLFRRFAPSW